MHTGHLGPSEREVTGVFHTQTEELASIPLRSLAFISPHPNPNLTVSRFHLTQTLRAHRHGVTCVLQTASVVLGTSNPLAEPDLPRLLVSAAEGKRGGELG